MISRGGNVAIRIVLVLAAMMTFYGCGQSSSAPEQGEKEDVEKAVKEKKPEGVKVYDVGPPNQHTEEEVDYERSPPVGGEHNPVWQNAGFYEQPVRDENAVHTLEHGAVWIAYSPDLPADQQDRIRQIVESQSCVLASPYSGLDSPVVASAWGRQLGLESADRPELERFVRAYRLGPQAPEPGAPCTGGVGRPQ
jgi:hypothetical protein